MSQKKWVWNQEHIYQTFMAFSTTLWHIFTAFAPCDIIQQSKVGSFRVLRLWLCGLPGLPFLGCMPWRPSIPGHPNVFFSWYTVCFYDTSCLHYCAILELQSDNFYLEKFWETLCFVCFLPCQTGRSICTLQNRSKNSLSPKTWCSQYMNIQMQFTAWSFSIPCNTLPLS